MLERELFLFYLKVNMPSATSHTINDYETLLVALQDVLGVVVPEGQRSNLVERVEPILSGHNLKSLGALAQSLQTDTSGAFKSEVLEVISRRQISWCLNPEIIKVLHNYVFEQLSENARIWLVGCGQGAQAYALAMEVAEYVNKTGDTKKIEILATDGSIENIKQAELATYDEANLVDLNEGYKKLYTSKTNNGEKYQMKARVTELVNFKQCSLTEDFQSLGAMDLIICPDALVYFSNGVKKNILQQFSSLLKSGGILLTGNNQTMIASSEGFERVNHPAGVFYRQVG